MGVKLDHVESRILDALQKRVRAGSSPTVDLDDVATASGVERDAAYELLQNDRTLVRRGLVARVADEIWELTVEGEDFVAVPPSALASTAASTPVRPQPDTASTPRAFISYSHDSPEHKAWVAMLASRLVQAGIDAILDAWDLDLGMDLAKFMERSVSEVDRVLVICTEVYVRKADAGRGGVGYETMIVTGELLQDIDTKKFIPLIRQAGTMLRPRSLSTRLFVDFNDDSRFEASFEELVRALHASPATAKPRLGTNPFSQPKDPLPKDSHPDSAVPSKPAGDQDHWIELLNHARTRQEWVECDSPLELDLGFRTASGPRSTSPAHLAGPVRVARVEARSFELGFPLANRGGITMVVVPFVFVEAIWPGAEGRLHLRLNKTILFADGKSTFV